MAENKQEFKVGDLVRIRGAGIAGSYCHGIYQGAVCRVLEPSTLAKHIIDVEGPYRLNGRPVRQAVSYTHLKLAKQAMRKRDEYAARR